MKTARPNNYPIEGDHSAVTAAGVREMERQRPRYNSTVDYTIDGAVEGEVHTTVEAAREYAINRGHRILNQASNDLGADVQKAARRPHRLDFNKIKEEAQEHLRGQSQSQVRGQTP